ncbi:MAG: polysaccharide biosynthesis protein [Acidimicrobiia bacterium]|nr:polysaccharide biosynthesis protein [Acidimicrobiia bacterium]
MARALSAVPGRRFGTGRVARISVDCLIWAAALYVGLGLRLDFNAERIADFDVAVLVPIACLASAGFGFMVGLYRGRWTLGSFEEVPALGFCSGLTTLVLVVVDVTVDTRLVPVTSVLIAGLIAFVAMGGVRHLVRRAVDQHRRVRDDGRARAIVFGAGEGGQRMVRSMLYESGSSYHPVAVLDDDPLKRNLSVRGVRVVGDRSVIGEVAKRTGASTLVIAVPTGEGALIRDLSDSARGAGLEVRVVPSVDELLNGNVRIRDLRAPTEADLLGRHAIQTDLVAVSEYLQGRRVVVTGAGGSIGSELCRQIAAFDPERLVMIDRDESNLHAVQLSIEGRALLDSADLLLADIRDRQRIWDAMQQIQPDVVFHAAALKHLPLLQTHPVEALKTNVWGTASVLNAAAAAGVSRFVNISTDKAANASSVLGYSKRIAEALTAHYGHTEPGRFLSVRFGNVLGSRGSVLTTFRAQLEARQPLTVTDPDVTRYFMTVEEAVQLVIQAGAIGRDGEVLVLDMGDPVRIADVARQMAASLEPGSEIVFTGLRPGEKLHEELFCRDEIPRASEHSLIRTVEVPPLAPSLVEGIDTASTPEEMVRLLRELVEDIDDQRVIDLSEADSPRGVAV